MFPSSSASTEYITAKKRAFDPTADCVFSAEKKKKKACRNRGTSVTFVLISDIQKGVPRRKADKDKLIADGHSKKTDVFRSMSVNQVQAKVLRLFAINSFEYLEVNGTNLFVGTNQLLNGDEVIESAVKRKGHTMYIRKQPNSQESNSQSITEPSIEEVQLHMIIANCIEYTILSYSLQSSLFLTVLRMNYPQLP